MLWISILRLPQTATKIRYLGRPISSTFTNFGTTSSTSNTDCWATFHSCILLACLDFVSFDPSHRSHVIRSMVWCWKLVPVRWIFQLSDGFILLCRQCSSGQYHHSKLLWSWISVIYSPGFRGFVNRWADCRCLISLECNGHVRSWDLYLSQ